MRTRWCFTLLCFLLGGFIDSLSSSSVTHIQSITTKVGNQAVLPCSWKSRLGEEALPTCHIQWATPVDTVFELRGEQKYEAEEFKGRVEVPEERLGSGDCSLIISDVQIGDTGRYESFMVVDGARTKKTRVFIQSIKLSVFDHKSRQSRAPGDDLVLDLYTRHSSRVLFQGRNSSQWADLWMRGDEDSERLEKHPHREQLTMRKLTSSDEGTYKVLDEHGLAVSTVQLSVEGERPTGSPEQSTASRFQQNRENQAPAGDAVRSSGSDLLVLSAVIITFQILHLL
ncbi:galectin 17 isoform X1 [Acanthopagrus latus]|uniref:galectin 17 isoform X1 n=1 Tax=Acanthopagrus latus TaxID=8177 RepID=UPI00187C7AD9|nr:galectin 17 isoform X1 [Acanthopagrus latus]